MKLQLRHHWPTQPSIPPGSVNEAKTGMAHSVSGCMQGVQVKL